VDLNVGGVVYGNVNMETEVFAVRIGRIASLTVFYCLWIASSSPAFETEVDGDPPTILVGPDGQMRILIALPLYGACDVVWCEDHGCAGGCAADWAFLSDFRVDIELDGERASRTFEVAAYPIITYWDRDDVSWDSPWETLGGDFLIPADWEWRDCEVIEEGKKKKWLRFRVLDAVLAALEEDLPIYGFVLTAPVPDELQESDTGLLPQEVGELGRIEAVHFQLGFDLGVGRDFGPEPPIIASCAEPPIAVLPPGPQPTFPSDVKWKGSSHLPRRLRRPLRLRPLLRHLR
jgi:hypothetical protein